MYRSFLYLEAIITLSSTILLNCIVFFFFITLSAFFSSAETAFTAINRIKLRKLIDENPKKAKPLNFLLSNPKHLLSCILIGNNLANIAATTFATAFFLDLFLSFGIQSFAAIMTSITVIITFILLVFGEITPKTIAMKNPSKWALRISPIIYFFYFVELPFIFLFTKISNGISYLFGIHLSQKQSSLTEDEIKLLIKLGQEDGILEKGEQKMLDGVFNVSNKIVREIMTPRIDMVCVELRSSVSAIIELITSKGHSRIPVYEDKIDNIVGFIYAKDLLTANPSIKTLNLKSFMRDPIFIPETKNIDSLLQQMRQSKFHLAIVVDEHGGVSGLATMEDIIEEIVGEIQDEYDKEKLYIKQLTSSHYHIDAGVSIDDFGDHIGFDFPEDEDYDTVAGFLISQLDSFPSKGQVVSYEHIDFTIKEIRNRRIISIDVVMNPKAPE